MRCRIRHIFSLLAVICLSGCAKKTPAPDQFSPSELHVTGYAGSTKHFPVEFQLNGAPMNPLELSFESVRNDRFAYGLAVGPLNGTPILSFAPIKGGEPQASARFTVKYRGNEYPFSVIGDVKAAVSCALSANGCLTNQFNADREACESVPNNGAPCEEEDCANPGVCQNGLCVHAPLPQSLPICPSHLPATPLEPLWSYELIANGSLMGQFQLDDDGNSYFFEGYTCELISLDGAGQTRWRVGVERDVCVRDEFSVLLLAGEQLISFNLRSAQLDVFQTSDGQHLWGKHFTLAPYSTAHQVLPVGDTLWVLVNLPDVVGATLLMFDLATGAERRPPLEVRTLDAGDPRYIELVDGKDGRVYLVAMTQPAVEAKSPVAALDAVTGERLWATGVPAWHAFHFGQSAFAGSTLLLPSGATLDVQTGESLDNHRWQDDAWTGTTLSLALGAAGTGWWERETLALQEDRFCPVTSLRAIDARQGVTQWECFLGSHSTNPGILHRTPSGAAAIITRQRRQTGWGVPTGWGTHLRILSPQGQELSATWLQGGDLFRYVGPRFVIRGQRLLLMQTIPGYSSPRLFAYDVPELAR